MFCVAYVVVMCQSGVKGIKCLASRLVQIPQPPDLYLVIR